jgi:hypothetical protein
MGVERVHDGVEQGLQQVWRIGELLFAVVRRRLDQGLVFQQLAFDDAIHVNKRVVVGQLPLKQTVHLADNFLQVSLFVTIQHTLVLQRVTGDTIAVCMDFPTARH